MNTAAQSQSASPRSRAEPGSWWQPLRPYALWAAIALGITAVGGGAAQLLVMQQAGELALAVRVVTALGVIGWTLWSVFSRTTDSPLAATGIHLGLLVGGSIVAEGASQLVSAWLGTPLQLAACVTSTWWMWHVSRSRPELRLAASLLAGTLAAAGFVWFCGRREWFGMAIGLAGVVALTDLFLLGLAGLRLVLSPTSGITAVARTLLDEAIRMRVALVLVILFVITLPLLPLLLDPDERLEYRVQFLLTWSLGATGFVLGLLTIFLASGSICGDIDSSRIHMTLTKPLGRLEFLIGKWLGLISLNMLLVLLGGTAIYVFTLLLTRTAATDMADRQAVESQVLTARRSVLPKHPRGEEFEKDMAAQIAALEKESPDAFRSNRELQIGRIRHELIWQWHTVTASREGEFVFTGLEEVKAQSPVVQLQLKPHADNTDINRADVRFALWLNGRAFPWRDGKHQEYTLASSTLHTITLPSAAITDDGFLKVTFANRNIIPPGETEPTSINFSPGKGLQLLHRVGSFEGNYLKGMVFMWLKLVTIAAVGVAASTYLGFPVATLLSLMVFLAAVGSSFLGDAVDFYTGLDFETATLADMARLRFLVFQDFLNDGDYWGCVKVILAIFGELFLAVIPSFNRFDGVTSIATGQAVSGRSLAECVLRLGFVAPLAIGLLGWVIFERRDLVRSNS